MNMSSMLDSDPRAPMKTVMVSGCYDLLHAGHVAFLREAAAFGRLVVCLGSDANIELLKGHRPLFSQEERAYLVGSIGCVGEARVSRGFGMLDFEPELRELKPDYFVVNRDGHTPAKEALCRELGINYRVMERVPAHDFPARSSTDSKCQLELPYRVCLAGGWLDQPWVSALAAGPVVVARIEPLIEYMDRAGMATSTRRTAAKLWGSRIPQGDLEETAKILFACENPPGTRYVSGSQDALGLVLPGISRLHYAGGYWPVAIESCTDPEVALWLQRIVHLVPVAGRPQDYDPLVEQHLEVKYAARLAAAGQLAWDSIMARDAAGLGHALDETMAAWRQLLPLTCDNQLLEKRAELAAGCYGSCYSGCGGGYLMLVHDGPVAGEVPLRVTLPCQTF